MPNGKSLTTRPDKAHYPLHHPLTAISLLHWQMDALAPSQASGGRTAKPLHLPLLPWEVYTLPPPTRLPAKKPIMIMPVPAATKWPVPAV